GQPIRWREAQESWEWWARCWGFVLRGAGVEPTDRVFFPFSFGLFIGFWAGFEGARALGALAIPGGGQDSATRLAWMQALGATVLVCTPSYALHLIEVARERGQDLSQGCVRLPVHAGAPCACGRTFVRLGGRILARLDDMPSVRGVNVFPAAIEGVVRRFPAVDEFQIEVFRDAQRGGVRVRVELEDTTRVRRVQGALRD